MTTQHPLAPEQGEDEDYVDYIGRLADFYTNTPPPAPVGFELVECTAQPRHWPAYTVADDTFYPATCPSCTIGDLIAEHAECEHSHHGAWRRWKATHWVVGRLYTLGIISCSGTKWGGGCNRCLTDARWTFFRGPYVLGLQREAWQCLRRGHRRRVHHYAGLCAVCCPCPECGSTGVTHTTCEVRP